MMIGARKDCACGSDAKDGGKDKRNEEEHEELDKEYNEKEQRDENCRKEGEPTEEEDRDVVRDIGLDRPKFAPTRL